MTPGNAGKPKDTRGLSWGQLQTVTLTPATIGGLEGARHLVMADFAVAVIMAGIGASVSIILLLTCVLVEWLLDLLFSRSSAP